MVFAGLAAIRDHRCARCTTISASVLAVQLLDLERAGDTPFAEANTDLVQENATIEMFMSAAKPANGVLRSWVFDPRSM